MGNVVWLLPTTIHSIVRSPVEWIHVWKVLHTEIWKANDFLSN